MLSVLAILSKNFGRCWVWAEWWKLNNGSFFLITFTGPNIDKILSTKEMPDGTLAQQITQHQPQAGSWDLKAREKLHNTQKFALAQGGDTVAPLRVCSAISASHDFSVLYFRAWNRILHNCLTARKLTQKKSSFQRIHPSRKLCHLSY